MQNVIVHQGGTPVHRVDKALNDSDKSFTVPVGKVWWIQDLFCGILTSATVGNRSLGITVTDGTDIVWSSGRTGNIAASSNGAIRAMTGVLDTAAPIRYDGGSAAAYGVSASDGLPDRFFIPAGYVIRMWDVAAIDAAADDLYCVLGYIEYEGV